MLHKEAICPISEEEVKLCLEACAVGSAFVHVCICPCLARLVTRQCNILAETVLQVFYDIRGYLIGALK